VVCGDLTSAFNFRSPNEELPSLPSTTGYAPPASDLATGARFNSVHPAPPATPAMPSQEQGVRMARALPYNLRVDGDADPEQGKFAIGFANPGAAGVCFHVRSGNSAAGPWSYTVEPGKSLNDTWDLAGTAGQYDLSVYGPNGYFRSFKGGGIGANFANLDIDSIDIGNGESDDVGLGIAITNKGSGCVVTVTDQYTGRTQKHRLQHGQKIETLVRLEHNYGWYDLAVTVDTDAAFKWQLGGHVENGRNSFSDPAMAAMA